MKNPPCNLPVLFLVLCLGSVSTLAADPNGKAATNKIYAQKLVNDVVGRHVDLLILGLHGIPPAAKDEVMIAGNIDHIGNADSTSDIAAATKHMTLMEPKAPEKFEITVPMRDVHDNYIGAIVMIFKRAPNEPEAAIYMKALGIQNELARKIPSYAALFDPN
ncbi:MAG: hypothetical protein ABI222_07635 [Opitutaceae bacterium]